MDSKEREYWVDAVKIVACLLVVLGHFYQSMVFSGILSDGKLYYWFNSAIYCFHVQLFFICSGYLYQKHTVINSFDKWANNLLRKLIALGIPYFVFLTITWILKNLFSQYTNIKMEGYLDTLLLNPTAPYWYLYVLFFIFVITITMNKPIIAVVQVAVALLFLIPCICRFPIDIYVVDKVMTYEAWFVAGMLIAYLNGSKKQLKVRRPLVYGFLGASIIVAFLVLKLEAVTGKISFRGDVVAFGLLACIGVVLLAVSACSGDREKPLVNFFSKYTFPIFLMHTLFAATTRSILFRIGIFSASVHIAVGLFASFVGPMIAAFIMGKIKWLNFLLYPGKYIKIEKK